MKKREVSKLATFIAKFSAWIASALTFLIGAILLPALIEMFVHMPFTTQVVLGGLIGVLVGNLSVIVYILVDEKMHPYVPFINYKEPRQWEYRVHD